jgi:hypothetical protein
MQTCEENMLSLVLRLVYLFGSMLEQRRRNDAKNDEFSTVSG